MTNPIALTVQHQAGFKAFLYNHTNGFDTKLAPFFNQTNDMSILMRYDMIWNNIKRVADISHKKAIVS
jgi:hypothetical protein